MTQEERYILLEDLCKRLPYGVKVRYSTTVVGIGEVTNIATLKSIDLRDKIPILACFTNHEVYDIKMDGQIYYNIMPFLRPVSSMTDEERRQLSLHLPNRYLVVEDRVEIPDYITFECVEVVTNFLYEHHIDIHGLIPLGYSLTAPEGMYKEKN